jgi:hypothetical protein
MRWNRPAAYSRETRTMSDRVPPTNGPCMTMGALCGSPAYSTRRAPSPPPGDAQDTRPAASGAVEPSHLTDAERRTVLVAEARHTVEQVDETVVRGREVLLP